MNVPAPAAERSSACAPASAQAEAASAESLHVARQLERAQAGDHVRVLSEAEQELRHATGDLADGRAGMHFVRVVSLLRCGHLDDVLPAVALMQAAAVREDSQGWLSCALSMQVDQIMERESRDQGHHDAEAALRGLVAAETALERADDDAVQRCNAHANLGIGYEFLRLYELAGPHYEAAHAESLRVPDGGANPMLWSGNLSMMHLQWALELYRVGQVDEAERQSAKAAEAAEVALAESHTWGDERRIAMTELQRDCALADGPLVDEVTDRLVAASDHLREQGVSELTYFAAPFVSVALSRTGRHEQALEYIDRAWREGEREGNPLSDAAITHTRAMLLAEGGSADAAAGLEYGNIMAKLLWRERLRSLHMARTLREFESLRTLHEQVTLTASTDALTGLVNRRGLDDVVDHLADQPTPVGVLVVDLDRFKEINDTLGHDAGDDVLRRVAGAISAVVRANDTVARTGGDEFVVVLPGATTSAAASVAQRAVDAVASLQTLATISVGVSVLPGPQIRSAFTAADAAMYVAKRAGGGRVHLAC